MFVDSLQRSVYDVVSLSGDDELAIKAALGLGGKCPECDGRLIARRPRDKVWHWAHHRRSPDCSGGAPESEWHLLMKMALKSAGYALEVWDSGTKLRFDAVANDPDADFAIVEVVNSNSDKYLNKAVTINKTFGAPTLWIINKDSLLTRQGRYKSAFVTNFDIIKSLGHTVWVFGDTLNEFRSATGDVITHPLHAHILATFGELSLRSAQAIVDKRVWAQDYARKRQKEDMEKIGTSMPTLTDAPTDRELHAAMTRNRRRRTLDRLSAKMSKWRTN